MSNLEEIEKLHDMKERGVISEEEFNTQKEKLLQQGSGQKSQLAYCLLAFFLGTLGVHNFYAGRWKRGLAQLLITVLTFFLGSVLTWLWAIINIFAIHTDGKGNEFEPCKEAKYILGILGIVGYVWMFIAVLGVMSIAGIAGYTMAMERYQENALMNYVSQISVSAMVQDGKISQVDCDSFEVPRPEFFMGNCVAYPDGKVVLSGVDDHVKQNLVGKGQMQEDGSGNLIFSH